MQNVGLIGLGLLGSALADRLLFQGYHVIGFDISSERRDALTSAGGTAATSSDVVCQDCDVLLLSLPDSRIVADVVGRLMPLLRDRLVIDTTTGAPDDSATLGRKLSDVSARFLDATVVGSSEQARNGEITVLAGGTESAFAAALPLLKAISTMQFHTGACGTGATAKLIVNLVLGLNRAVLAEGLNLARGCGMDLDQMLGILQSGAAYSRVMDIKGRKMIEGDFSPQARLDQHAKDVRLILELAQKTGSAVPLSELHAKLLQRASQMGFGQQDNSAIIRAFEESHEARA